MESVSSPRILEVELSRLVSSAMAWWDKNRSLTFPLGDGDEDNVFDRDPDFVTKAESLNKEFRFVPEKKRSKWVKSGPRNFILDSGTWCISWNPRPADEISLDGETAIVSDFGGKREYYILKGDYRKQYESLFKLGFHACFDFYLAETNKQKIKIVSKLKPGARLAKGQM